MPAEQVPTPRVTPGVSEEIRAPVPGPGEGLCDPVPWASHLPVAQVSALPSLSDPEEEAMWWSEMVLDGVRSPHREGTLCRESRS